MSNEVERIGEPRSDVLYRSGSVNKWAWNGGGGESSDANSGVVRERRLPKTSLESWKLLDDERPRF